jgi:DNA-directed RNA polymerase specialized sigma24 family protein
VINRIRDEVRRIGRRPVRGELPADMPSDDTSGLEAVIKAEAYQRYRSALAHLRSRDRDIVLARIEAQWDVSEIADHFGMRTFEAARMAITRALRRLAGKMSREGPSAV